MPGLGGLESQIPGPDEGAFREPGSGNKVRIVARLFSQIPGQDVFFSPALGLAVRGYGPGSSFSEKGPLSPSNTEPVERKMKRGQPSKF